ncbi:MAG: Hsp20 family protein [Alphaproteobacteria bacterium]|nr:MAG: Hsp20 family protein [Alphaproteobacteria bacterium]
MTRTHYKPLFRSTIGFDSLFDFLEGAMTNETATPSSYPPYNIEKFDDDRYIITMAVSGFIKSELEVVVQESRLMISGSPRKTQEEGVYLHKGIASRAFQQTFNLADFMEIDHVALDNGLLRIFLSKHVPESKKPKKLEISEDTLSGKRTEKRLLSSE